MKLFFTMPLFEPSVAHRAPATMQFKPPSTPPKSKVQVAWQRFSENTTFHGMRFVCGTDIHIVRRLTWLLLVVLCLLALGLQVSQQVIYFYKNPKTVNVQTIFAESVKFPAVTICNQNSFRITEAYKEGLYDVIYNMFMYDLDMDMLKKYNATHTRLDELDYLLGHKKEDMILRCTWGDEECGPENFTTILTDHGLCFTFNGPGTDHPPLYIKTPGSSYGLKLILNVEEYERMMGPHVASGVRMLIHPQHRYPLVGQLGQVVATGSHTFVALSLQKASIQKALQSWGSKLGCHGSVGPLNYEEFNEVPIRNTDEKLTFQEHRLGRPFDECEDRSLKLVSNQTYSYDVPTCQMECYTEFLIKECGCKDFFQPGDAEVCTIEQFMNCLLSTEKKYNQLFDKPCDCAIPCHFDSIKPSFSYASLSSAAQTKFNSRSLTKIGERYRKALDTLEYLNPRSKGKQAGYREFGRLLKIVKDQYDYFIDEGLTKASERFLWMRDQLEVANKLRDDFLTGQLHVVNKNFLDAKAEMDERTLGEIADDIHMLSNTVERKIKEIVEFPDETGREVFYKLLLEQLNGRMNLAKMSYDNFTKLVDAFKTGEPLFEIGEHGLSSEMVISGVGGPMLTHLLVPRQLLVKALNHSKEAREVGLAMGKHILEIHDYLDKVVNISTDSYMSGELTPEKYSELLITKASFREACNNYLKARQNFYGEVIDWPVKELNKKQQNLRTLYTKCVTDYNGAQSSLTHLRDELKDTLATTLKFLDRLSHDLKSYVEEWKVTKFDLAAIVSHATVDVTSSSNMASFGIDIKHRLFSLTNCIISVGQELSEDEEFQAFYEYLKAQIQTDITPNSNKLKEEARIIENSLQPILTDDAHGRLIRSYEAIAEELINFNQSAEIDPQFYKDNFIFLDIFFPDISYTVTDQQSAFDAFKLLSDIGGSMGLLVGASAISLFEFVDFFCVVILHFFKTWRRPMDKAFNSKGPVMVT